MLTDKQLYNGLKIFRLASQMNDEKNRAQLISLLWTLKVRIKKNPGAIDKVNYVHLSSLLRDEDYRQMVLDSAAKSSDKEIADLAHQLLSLNQPGALIKRADTGDSPIDEKITPEPVPSKPSPIRSRSDSSGTSKLFIWGGLALVSMALIIGAWNFIAPGSTVVSGSITEDTYWKTGKTYILDGLVFVESNTRLDIQAGVKILGNPGSALIITRDAQINAQGTRSKPVVFSSSKPVGKRERGAWGGLVLLGNAPINTKVGQIEGIAANDPRGRFGGSAFEDSCGVLKYVRIEFAGYEIAQNNELNGLTLGGCGAGTIIDYVQVHMGLDDGIELFGGVANLKHIVISRSGDDGLDWDRGWQGNGQFIVIQQGTDDGDNGIEADNNKKNKDASPRSSPTLSNVSIVGSGNSTTSQRGILLRRGTGIDLRNTLITGFSKEAFDIRDVQTANLTSQNKLSMQGIVVSSYPLSREFFTNEKSKKNNDDGAFDEENWFSSDKSNHLLRTPMLTSGAFNDTSPVFTPAAKSVLGRTPVAIPQGEFWDEGANFVGAVRPGNRQNWLENWTSYPLN